MPYHEVHCPCGKTSMIYRAPAHPVPKYCNMKCRRLFFTGSVKKKYVFTTEMDAEILKVYQKAVYMPGFHKTAPVKRLAQRLKIPRWTISKRAGLLGVRRITKKEPNWSKDELRILARQAYKHPEVIQRHLKKAGYHRSVQGIVLKRKRMYLLQGLEFETARSLAGCLGIDGHAVFKYIQKGLLKAKRRGTKRTWRQGGDHYMIKPMDIRKFIIENVSILDFRKIDKFWLVDLLAGGDLGLGPFKLIKSTTHKKNSNSETGAKMCNFDGYPKRVDPEVLAIFEESALIGGQAP